MRSNNLRKQVKTMLDSLQLAPVFYNIADTDAMFPHIVFNLSGVNHNDINRNDYDLQIDVYGKKQEDVLDIADTIEDLFRTNNAPTDDILPSYYLEARTQIEDTDKDIRRELIRFNVQLYDIEGD